jgi:hypothetical protein
MKKAVMMTALMMLGGAGSAFAGGAVVGQPAPDFTLVDSNGQKHTLSSYKGKHVVLEWVNFGCPFVVKHYGSGNMQKLQKAYTGKGVVWLSVNSSGPGLQGNFTPAEVNAQLKEKGGAASAYLLDSDGKVGHLYGARTTPHMFIIDPQGTLVYAGGIDDKPSTDQADIASATNYVASGLDQALAGKKIVTAVTKPYGCSVKYATTAAE